MAFGHVIGVYSSSIIAGVVIHMITAISIGVAVGVFLYKTSILNISKLSNGLLYGLLAGSIVFIVLGEMWTESIRMANLNGAKWTCEGERNPINDNASDVVISNCVINLTLDKVAAFKEIYRILRSNGRMVISDLVTSKEVDLESVNSEDWCSCIDGALTKENYIESIRKAGFYNIETLQEMPYIEKDGRKITIIVIKAVK